MKNLLALLSLFTCSRALSQDSLSGYNHQRNRITLTGMKVLGSWGVANLAGGGIGWASTQGADKYFYQMSTFWGGINLGLALFGSASARKKLNQPLTAEESANAQKKMETIFLVNTGLDVVYVGAGLYMKTRGNQKNNTTLQGYGSAVMLQGIFLFVFDGVMYQLQRSNGNGLRKFLSKNDVIFSGKSVGISHRL